MKVSTMPLRVFGSLFSLKRNLRQLFKPPAEPVAPPITFPASTRFFFVVVEVDNGEPNITLMESIARLTETLQLPDGYQIRASYEVSADVARVVISM